MYSHGSFSQTPRSTAPRASHSWPQGRIRSLSLVPMQRSAHLHTFTTTSHFLPRGTGFVWSPEPGWACVIQPPSPPGKLCLQVIYPVCFLSLRLPTKAFSGLYLKLDLLSLLDFSCRNNQRHQKYCDFTCPFTVPAPTLWFASRPPAPGELPGSCGIFFAGIVGTGVRHRHHEAQGRKP